MLTADEINQFYGWKMEHMPHADRAGLRQICDQAIAATLFEFRPDDDIALKTKVNIMLGTKMKTNVYWQQTETGLWELTNLPTWQDGAAFYKNWHMTLIPRPAYCDRGRWLALCDAPLDAQEGWPRYYFTLETACTEILAWLKARAELKHYQFPDHTIEMNEFEVNRET